MGSESGITISHLQQNLMKLRPGVFFTISKIANALKVKPEWLTETLKELIDSGEQLEFDTKFVKIRRLTWENEFEPVSYTSMKQLPEGVSIEECAGNQYEEFHVKGRTFRERIPKCFIIRFNGKIIGIESIKKPSK